MFIFGYLTFSNLIVVLRYEKNILIIFKSLYYRPHNLIMIFLDILFLYVILRVPIPSLLTQIINQYDG